MRSFPQIELGIMAAGAGSDPHRAAADLLEMGEEVLEHWIIARDETPTTEVREGFRLLALHRQGARGEPSFNACRETCRELVYHYNLITLEPDHPETEKRLKLAGFVANHLYLFVHGKMEESQLDDFCCSSKPIHGETAGAA